MFMKKRMAAVCVLLTAFVLASCGKQEDTAGAAAGAAAASSGTKEASVTAEPAGDSTGSPADSTGTEEDGTKEDGTEKGDTNGGDHALTGQKWEWVYWDGDKDGEEEQISFEYVDNGDEAESFILVTLEVGGSSEAYIDRAGRIVRISDREDEEGPYLLVEYNYENVFSEEADMECTVRLRDGAVVVEETDGGK